MSNKRTYGNDMILTRGLRVLLQENPVVLDEQGRIEMTASCHDADDIPKVPRAGEIEVSSEDRLQIMHNGVRVLEDCYYGPWMTSIIKRLRGHHEPQEERVFHEVLKLVPQGGTMLELGSYWSYYSLWFFKQIAGARAICCEPDPYNLEIGRRNAEVNDMRISFRQGVAAASHGSTTTFVSEERPSEHFKVPMLSVDGLVAELGLRMLDLLHMDVQGAELDVLQGSANTIAEGRLRFIFVSTHHYVYSGDPLTHEKCIRFIEDRGGHVIASHAVLESFSGDGLIVASFDDRDREIHYDVSVNRTDRSLYRPYERDIALLASQIAALEMDEKRPSERRRDRDSVLVRRFTRARAAIERLRKSGDVTRK